MQQVNLALALCALGALTAACNRGSQAQQGGMPPPPPVSVAPIVEREVRDFDEFSGRLEAVQQVEVRARVSGHIQKVAFQEGAEVKQGDVLFVIDARAYDAELKRAQAELATASNRADLAQSRLARADDLLRQKFISKEGYDERLSEHRGALAQVAAAQAAVDAARLNLEFTQVRAPIAGRVGRAAATLGNLVNAGSSEAPLTTIMSLNPIHAYFDADEQVYLKLPAASAQGANAATVRMGLANEIGFPHQGKIDFVDNRLDPKSGTIRVRAVFDNVDRRLTPGLFARIRLEGGKPFRAILINDKAVGTDQSQKFVLVVGKDNVANYRAIKLGSVIDGLRVVAEGLKAGEVIVVNGLQRVRPGTPVTPQQVTMEHPDGPPPEAPKKQG